MEITNANYLTATPEDWAAATGVHLSNMIQSIVFLEDSPLAGLCLKGEKVRLKNLPLDIIPGDQAFTATAGD